MVPAVPTWFKASTNTRFCSQEIPDDQLTPRLCLCCMDMISHLEALSIAWIFQIVHIALHVKEKGMTTSINFWIALDSIVITESHYNPYHLHCTLLKESWQIVIQINNQICGVWPKLFLNESDHLLLNLTHLHVKECALVYPYLVVYLSVL